MTGKAAVQEFMDAIHVATDEIAFAGAASRLGEAFGFRWFTYLSVGDGKPDVISTYPAIWSDHYFNSGYAQVDPVISASRRQTVPFFWGALDSARPSDAAAVRLFDDAASFGIVSGMTVPFRGRGTHSPLYPLDRRSLARSASTCRGIEDLCAGLWSSSSQSSCGPRRPVHAGASQAYVDATAAGLPARGGRGPIRQAGGAHHRPYAADRSASSRGGEAPSRSAVANPCGGVGVTGWDDFLTQREGGSRCGPEARHPPVRRHSALDRCWPARSTFCSDLLL